MTREEELKNSINYNFDYENILKARSDIKITNYLTSINQEALHLNETLRPLMAVLIESYLQSTFIEHSNYFEKKNSPQEKSLLLKRIISEQILHFLDVNTSVLFKCPCRIFEGNNFEDEPQDLYNRISISLQNILSRHLRNDILFNHYLIQSYYMIQRDILSNSDIYEIKSDNFDNYDFNERTAEIIETFISIILRVPKNIINGFFNYMTPHLRLSQMEITVDNLEKFVQDFAGLLGTSLVKIYLQLRYYGNMEEAKKEFSNFRTHYMDNHPDYSFWEEVTHRLFFRDKNPISKTKISIEALDFLLFKTNREKVVSECLESIEIYNNMTKNITPYLPRLKQYSSENKTLYLDNILLSLSPTVLHLRDDLKKFCKECHPSIISMLPIEELEKIDDKKRPIFVFHGINLEFYERVLEETNNDIQSLSIEKISPFETIEISDNMDDQEIIKTFSSYQSKIDADEIKTIQKSLDKIYETFSLVRKSSHDKTKFEKLEKELESKLYNYESILKENIDSNNQIIGYLENKKNEIKSKYEVSTSASIFWLLSSLVVWYFSKWWIAIIFAIVLAQIIDKVGKQEPTFGEGKNKTTITQFLDYLILQINTYNQSTEKLITKVHELLDLIKK